MNSIDKFIPSKIPTDFLFAKEKAERAGPKILTEAFKNYGLREIVGVKHSEEILDMARYLGGVIEDFYNADEIPWCGLAVSYWIKKAGFEPPKNYSQVRARDFSTWGKPVQKASAGDIMVFWRGSKSGRDGHVGLYIAEDEENFYILGGNQSNQVNIRAMAKTRFLAARRCPWKFLQPRGVKPHYMDGKTASRIGISENEA